MEGPMSKKTKKTTKEGKPHSEHQLPEPLNKFSNKKCMLMHLFEGEKSMNFFFKLLSSKVWVTKGGATCLKKRGEQGNGGSSGL
jgi:hypothetical protein